MSTPLVNMSKLYPKCQYFVGAPLFSSTALIHLGMEFTRASKAVAGILFHSSIMTSRSCWMLDTWCFSTFRLRMPHMCSIGFRSGDILGHFITFTFSFISKAVSSSSARQCHLHQQGSVIFISKAVSSSSARPCHLGGVFEVVIMLENCRSAQFLKGGHHLLLQNVTVHVGIM